MDTSTPAFVIIGGGLAGCECALALARAGLACTLYEQKPEVFSPAHVSPLLGELVCSNSFRSNDAQGSGVGLLKEEMRKLGSAVMAAAETCSVPAGKALAVDRTLFSEALTRRVEEEPLITLVRRQIPSLDAPELEGKTVIVAAGPLASENLASSIADIISENGEHTRLYFYDAIAPIVRADSVDMSIAFRGSRYGNDAPPPYSDDAPFLDKPMETMTDPEAKENGDYLNCPMTRAEYTAFYKALREAERVPAHDFEKEIHFEGCMPIEALADRGDRNTYVNAPECLNADLSLKARPNIHLAGQITGVEGYVESAACGLWLGLLLAARARGRELPLPPQTTALGALMNHLRTPSKQFTPSNIHFGLMPELAERTKKKARKAEMADRGRADFEAWRQQAGL